MMEDRALLDKIRPVLRQAAVADLESGPNRRRSAEAGRGPEYSMRRSFYGGGAVLAIAILAWPCLPRIYESTATLVLRPTDMEGQTDSSQAMRQPLDESFIVSDLDSFNSVSLAQTLIDKNQLADDDEFKVKPSLSERVATIASRLTGGLFFRSSARDRLPFAASSADMAFLSSPTSAKLRQNLWNKLVVHRDKQSYTVNVGFRSTDPLKAVALTQTLVSAYMDAQIKRKAENVDNMTKLLRDHVQEAKERAGISDAALQMFLDQSGLIDQGAQISLEAQLSALSTELATARAHSIDARTRSVSLEKMQALGTLDSAPEVLASPTIQRLNQSLTESMSRVAVMSTEAKSIAQQAEAERNRIVISAAVEADNWAERERLLNAEINKIRQDLVARRKAGVRLDELQRDADNDKQVLADAQTRLKQRAPILEALRPDAELLSPATIPLKPVFPILPLYAVGSLGMALIAGAAMNGAALRRDAKRLLKV